MQDDRSGAPLPAAQLQSAEVLVQVASLASLRLLSPVRYGWKMARLPDWHPHTCPTPHTMTGSEVSCRRCNSPCLQAACHLGGQRGAVCLRLTCCAAPFCRAAATHCAVSSTPAT